MSAEETPHVRLVNPNGSITATCTECDARSWDQHVEGRTCPACRGTLMVTYVPPRSRWRHVKSGAAYVVIGAAVREYDLEPLTLYQASPAYSEVVWTRPTAEFLDGRFAKRPAGTGDFRRARYRYRRLAGT